MLTSAITGLSEYFTPKETSGFMQLTNKEMLQTINSLSSLLKNSSNAMNTLKMPKIVNIGQQGSGKSSLICGLIGMNILPTNSQMETRCPLNLQLITNQSQSAWAEFEDKKISLTLPNPTPDEVSAIQHKIKQLTNEYAGNNKNISTKEIVLKIHSPNVPNLSIIDLPGLTLIPCLDKGQPADIKEQIRNLISSYIKDERTIILTVMQARSDLETDMGLELAKEFDPDSSRTIGVLTKIDLMNKGNDIKDYLENNISANLQLKYGYFGANNVKDESMSSSLEKEQRYFDTHEVYGNIADKSVLGRLNVGKRLSEILLDHIKATVPTILDEIRVYEKNIVEESTKLGYSLVTKSPNEKLTYTHMFLSAFCKEYVKALNEKGGLNYGRYLKSEFVNYRKQIRSISYTFSDDYISTMIQNCNGNHMDFSMFSIEILESCIQDSSQNVFKRFTTPSKKLVSTIQDIMVELITKIIESSELARFKAFKTYIKSETTTYIRDLCDGLNTRITDLIASEKAYIWTDNKQFNSDLRDLFRNMDKENSQPSIINKLINTYMNNVKDTMADRVPKLIMCFMVNVFMTDIYTKLFEHLGNQNIDALLSELPEIENKRIMYHEQQEIITKAKNVLQM
jgi:dynamin 1-like protein